MVLRKKGQSALLRFEEIYLLIIRKRSISPDLESADWPFLRNAVDIFQFRNSSANTAAERKREIILKI
jgi:hypothetical protein